MTIVAGFRVRDGVLLCADTLYSGSMKVYLPKIFQCGVGEAKFAFALSGSEDYGKMAFQDCEKAILQSPPEHRSKAELEEMIRRVIQRIVDDYVNTRPQNELENARFEFLISAWFKDKGTVLYSSRPPAMTYEPRFQCLGSGEYIGQYIIGPAYESDMPTHRAIVLATQALAVSKRHDVNCGGPSHYLLMKNDGTVSDLAHFDAIGSEQCIGEYDRLAQQLLLELGNTRMHEIDFAHKFNEFEGRVMEIRKQWKARASTYSKLVETARH